MAGIRTPEHIDDLQAPHAGGLRRARSPSPDRLERHYKDMQDIEFTDPGGQALSPADPRRASARRRAAVRMAVDLVQESVIDQHTALLRVNPRDLAQAARAARSTAASASAPSRADRLLARGLAAAPGGGRGRRSSSTPTGRWSGPRKAAR